MKTAPHPQVDLIALDRLVRQGAGYMTVAQKFAIPVGRAKTLVQQSRARQNLPPTMNPERRSKSAKVLHDEQISQLFREAVKARAARNLFLHRQVHRWEAPVPGPVGVCFVGDVHLGAAHTDYPAEEADRKLIRETEGLYCLTGGDGIDNPIKHLSMMVAADLNAAEQWKWLGDWLESLHGKLIGVCGGNHEEWTVATTGFPALRKTVEKFAGLPVDDARLQIDAVVGSQTYRLFMTHKSLNNSIFNPAHSIKQMRRMDYEFDAGCACDKHQIALETFRANNSKLVWALRPGSYQITSGRSRGMGYADAVPVCPGVILFPDERRLVGFVSVKETAYWLRIARADWAANRSSRRRNRVR